jgi:hypothetical protein
VSEEKTSGKAGWLLVFGLGLAAGWVVASWLSKDKKTGAAVRQRVRAWLDNTKVRLEEGVEEGREAARRAREDNGQAQG